MNNEIPVITDEDIIEFEKCGLSKPITLKQFKKATGLSLKEVKRAIKGLKDKNIIQEFIHTKKGVMYLINYDLEGLQNA